jgi:hypothetical protein
MNIPNEIWLNVFKHIDIKTMSSLMCSNKFFNKIIEESLWDIIDNMNNSGIFIPKNMETYRKYVYCVDWTTML